MKLRNLISKKMVLAASAMILTLGVTVTGAMAYFTASASSSGGHQISLDLKGKIVETVTDTTKTISVQNKGDTDIYVRVAILSGDNQSVAIAGEGWTAGGNGYYYYADPVAPGKTSGTITATITKKDDSDFDVVAVQESAPAIFADADGNLAANNADYAGWALTAKTAE